MTFGCNCNNDYCFINQGGLHGFHYGGAKPKIFRGANYPPLIFSLSIFNSLLLLNFFKDFFFKKFRLKIFFIKFSRSLNKQNFHFHSVLWKSNQSFKIIFELLLILYLLFVNYVCIFGKFLHVDRGKLWGAMAPHGPHAPCTARPE